MAALEEGADEDPDERDTGDDEGGPHDDPGGLVLDRPTAGLATHVREGDGLGAGGLLAHVGHGAHSEKAFLRLMTTRAIELTMKVRMKSTRPAAM